MEEEFWVWSRRNSAGWDDVVRFRLVGDEVRFDFFLLFDANTWETDSGSGVFTREGFARFLQDVRQEGYAVLREGGNEIAWRAIGDRTVLVLRGGSRGMSASLPEIPPSVFERFGVREGASAEPAGSV